MTKTIPAFLTAAVFAVLPYTHAQAQDYGPSLSQIGQNNYGQNNPAQNTIGQNNMRQNNPIPNNPEINTFGNNNLNRVNRANPVVRNVQPLTKEERKQRMQGMTHKQGDELRQNNKQRWQPLTDSDKRANRDMLKKISRQQ